MAVKRTQNIPQQSEYVFGEYSDIKIQLSYQHLLDVQRWYVDPKNSPMAFNQRLKELK